MILYAYAKANDILPICTACPTSEHERESAAARLLLERLYAEASERCPSLPRELPKILREAGGKPYFADRCVEFSLSHDAGCAFAALSTDARIGIDIVSLDREISRPSAVAARFFTEGERRALPREEDAEYREAFLRVWARKEAAVKLTGEGAAALSRTDTAQLVARQLEEAGAPSAGRALFEGETLIAGKRFFATIYIEK